MAFTVAQLSMHENVGLTVELNRTNRFELNRNYFLLNRNAPVWWYRVSDLCRIGCSLDVRPVHFRTLRIFIGLYTYNVLKRQTNSASYRHLDEKWVGWRRQWYVCKLHCGSYLPISWLTLDNSNASQLDIQPFIAHAPEDRTRGAACRHITACANLLISHFSINFVACYTYSVSKKIPPEVFGHFSQTVGNI